MRKSTLTLTADCAVCNVTYYGGAERFENPFCDDCGGPLAIRPAAPEKPKPAPVLNKKQRAALTRLLKLAPAQIQSLAFNANLAERYGATEPQCVRASQERKQLLADVETLKELVAQ